jgi:hypothetical protein
MESLGATSQVRYPMRNAVCRFTGMHRVYPVFQALWKSQNVDGLPNPMIELYGFHGKTITFMQGKFEGFPEKWPDD